MPKVTSKNNMPLLDFKGELILTKNDVAWEMRNHETPIAIQNVLIHGVKGLKFWGRVKKFWFIWKWLR